MQAIIVDQPGDESVMQLGDVASPPLGPGELRIRINATSVNRADLLQRQGLYPPPHGASEVIGLECAGTVAEVGDEVENWKIGDRAMALLPGGGYAQEAVVDVGSVLPVPADFTDIEAGATMEVFLTAYLNIFMLGEVPDGGTVLIHGGGSGVGTAGISLCREAGIKVLVTAGSDGKCQSCLEHGADTAINYNDGDFVSKVLEATDSRGVDVVLDCVGGKYLEQNLKCLTTNGALVVIGLMGGVKGEVNLARMLQKRLRIFGSTLRTRPAAEKAHMVLSFQNRFGDALANGRLRPAVDRVFPLSHVGDAHRLVKSGEHFGKVALSVD